MDTHIWIKITGDFEGRNIQEGMKEQNQSNVARPRRFKKKISQFEQIKETKETRTPNLLASWGAETHPQSKQASQNLQSDLFKGV